MTREEALAELLRDLKASEYRFVAVTPATHARVLARSEPARATMRDVFGWNRWFAASDVDARLVGHLRAAGALEECDGRFRSRLRVASLGGDLFLHSAFPTDDPDSVFLGPDTYRFARFIERQLPRLAGSQWLVDMGAGSGAGAIFAAKLRAFERIAMVDTNPAALELAAVNAAAAAVTAETLLSNAIPAGVDLIIANPPYMIDPARRSYRDGGGLLGGAVALDWARQGVSRLRPGGAMLLYSGAAYSGGRAPLLLALEEACEQVGASLEIEEIDPDVFGEELDLPEYRDVERIAAVGAVLRAR